MTFIYMIFGMFLVTYIPRMLPALFMDKMKVSGRFGLFMQLIPYTAMSALVFPGIFQIDDHIIVGVVGGLVAIGLSYKKLPVICVVIGSVIACLLLYMGGLA